jgi:hypothetical protein
MRTNRQSPKLNEGTILDQEQPEIVPLDIGQYVYSTLSKVYASQNKAKEENDKENVKMLKELGNVLGGYKFTETPTLSIEGVNLLTDNSSLLNQRNNLLNTLYTAQNELIDKVSKSELTPLQVQTSVAKMQSLAGQAGQLEGKVKNVEDAIKNSKLQDRFSQSPEIIMDILTNPAIAEKVKKRIEEGYNPIKSLEGSLDLLVDNGVALDSLFRNTVNPVEEFKKIVNDKPIRNEQIFQSGLGFIENLNLLKSTKTAISGMTLPESKKYLAEKFGSFLNSNGAKSIYRQFYDTVDLKSKYEFFKNDPSKYLQLFSENEEEKVEAEKELKKYSNNYLVSLIETYAGLEAYDNKSVSVTQSYMKGPKQSGGSGDKKKKQENYIYGIDANTFGIYNNKIWYDEGAIPRELYEHVRDFAKNEFFNSEDFKNLKEKIKTKYKNIVINNKNDFEAVRAFLANQTIPQGLEKLPILDQVKTLNSTDKANLHKLMIKGFDEKDQKIGTALDIYYMKAAKHLNKLTNFYILSTDNSNNKNLVAALLEKTKAYLENKQAQNKITDKEKEIYRSFSYEFDGNVTSRQNTVKNKNFIIRYNPVTNNFIIGFGGIVNTNSKGGIKSASEIDFLFPLQDTEIGIKERLAEIIGDEQTSNFIKSLLLTYNKKQRIEALKNLVTNFEDTN